MRAAFWFGFWFVILFLPADLAQAQLAPAALPKQAVRASPVVYIVQVPADAAYERWYAWAERCTGLKGNYRKVRWYLTAGPWSDGLHLGLTYGMFQKGHRITLNAPERLDSALVVHEVIHDLLSYHPEFPDTAVHPKVFYGGAGTCSKEYHE